MLVYISIRLELKFYIYFYVFQRAGLYNGQSQRIGREKQTARGNI